MLARGVSSKFLLFIVSCRRFAYPTCWQERGQLLVSTASGGAWGSPRISAPPPWLLPMEQFGFGL